MNVTIPLYVEERKRPNQPGTHFVVRPLFFEQPSRQAELLSRGTAKLAADLRKQLDEAGRAMRNEGLADWCFSPELAEHHLSLRLDLRRTAPACKALFVTFTAMGRKLAFAPALLDVWFEVPKGRDLRDRATEVLTAYFRRKEKEEDDAESVVRADLLDPPRAWVTGVELDVRSNPQKPKVPLRFLSLGGGGDVVSGREELEKVGRCLDWLFPDELDRVILRDAELEELSRLLGDADRRPVLLLGPRKVGKTALVHEYVYRRVEKQGSPYTRKHNVWLLSPQRLISGMSCVGEWENRLLAILKVAGKRQHVLYFDDLLGLYSAGLSRDSDLSAAHVLRPFAERRDVRLLAEATPEAFRVLQERDRGFADLFHVLPVREPDARQTLRILVESARRGEGKHRCTFDPDVLPAAVELQRRYVRDQAMPGKAAGFLAQLAVKYRGKPVGRDTVLQEFASRTGLSAAFLDARQRLERKDVTDALAREVMGQPAAVAAMADAVTVARARLNDPGRLLASFLFLGPTGVGKTQAAKALAGYLFGDPERLVRFDMNEYVGTASAARLVGTFTQPEGLLTAAVRRQPFCVILLDEIEKADFGVFDLLLQVLGEGRLTDSLGRTADFGNAIVVLTSNLGVREAATTFGLRPAGGAAGEGSAGGAEGDGHRERERHQAFVTAAERFFRPEFFNRLDRVIPFHALGRGDVRSIARKLIRDVFARDGLLQRKCILQVDEQAMERIVDQGFHPELGARALKREIEKQLTRPVAATLAGLAPGAPTVISLHAGAGGIAVQTQALDVRQSAVAPTPATMADPARVLEAVEDAVDRIEAEALEKADPGAEPVTAVTQGEIQPEHFRYFTLREQIDRVRRMVARAFDRLDAPKATRVVAGHAVARVPRSETVSWRRSGGTGHALWRSIVAAEEVNRYVADLARSAVPFGKDLDDQVRQVVHEAALLQAMSASAGGEDRAVLHLRTLDDSTPCDGGGLLPAYLRLFGDRYGMTCGLLARPGDAGAPGWLDRGSVLLLLETPGALRLARVEEGTHVFFPPGGGMLPVQVRAVPLADGADPLSAARADAEARRRWRSAVAAGTAAVADDPWGLGPVVRVYEGQGNVIDLRSGLMEQAHAASAAALLTFLLSQLPPPV